MAKVPLATSGQFLVATDTLMTLVYPLCHRLVLTEMRDTFVMAGAEDDLSWLLETGAPPRDKLETVLHGARRLRTSRLAEGETDQRCVNVARVRSAWASAASERTRRVARRGENSVGRAEACSGSPGNRPDRPLGGSSAVSCAR